MSEKSLFFNALPNANMPTGYDRNYNADDISDWLAVIWENGVVKGGLKVTASSGLEVNVEPGRAAIKGKAYVNSAIKSFTVATAPTGSASRYDYIVIKFDNNISTRDIKLELRTGTSAVPNVNNLTRNANVYELMLGYIEVTPNATAIAQSNITDKREDTDVCGYFTAVKGYDNYYDAIVQRYRDYVEVETLKTVITTNLASTLYNAGSDLASVYINGILINSEDYALSAANGYIVITFTNAVQAGQIVGIEIDRAYDGEGLPNVYEDYLNLKQAVENLSGQNDYVYTCNGVNDNVLLSTIAQTFLSGGNDRSNKTVRVYGTFGMTAPNNGDGNVSSPYAIFNLGLTTPTNRRITFDFSDCTDIVVATTAAKYYTMFAGLNVSIIGGSFSLSGMGIATMFNSTTGEVKATNSRFIVIGNNNSYIASNGTFTNCYSDVTNLTGTSYAYWVQSSCLLRLNGGEHYCYAAAAQINGVVYFPVGFGAGVINGASFPKVDRGGFIQTNWLYMVSGGGNMTGFGVVTTLASVTTSSATAKVLSTIPLNKANLG